VTIKVPNRREVLALNAELRKTRNSFALPDQSGHILFQVPTLDYIAWTNKYPELAASDPAVAKPAWRKFLNSDEGRQYKINPREGQRARATGIIVK